MKRKSPLAIVLFWAIVSANAIDLDSAVIDFQKTWPGLLKINIRSGAVLLVDPRMVFDQSVVVDGSVTFEPNRMFTKAFLKTSVNGATQYFSVTWIGIFQDAYLNVGPTPETVQNSGLYGSVFCLPGNGSLYVAHKIHHTSGQKYYIRKYAISGDTLRPTAQALTYLNLPSRVNKSTPFYSEVELTNQIGVLTPGSKVLIIGVEYFERFALGGGMKALVVTSSGLVGWTRNEVISNEHQQVKTALEALDYDNLSDP